MMKAKRFAEALVMAFSAIHGVDTRIARISIPTDLACAHRTAGSIEFYRAGAQGRSLTVYGTGEQTRSFCYVEDEIEGLLRLLMAPSSEDVHFPVNIGNPHELTVLEIAEKVIKLSNSTSRDYV